MPTRPGNSGLTLICIKRVQRAAAGAAAALAPSGGAG
jgi:hypothetical protein